ncbi:MAG: ATP phosphoribosyltransferase regulatory subunit [Gammaproteobacteria bacterium]|nr:MAG: ATP phosphoribosyltransferase regulatory subunit [Gammaproteobacteria bacterium]
MSGFERWQLPDGINELLAEEAWSVEFLRRAVIDLARERGYDLVAPPVVEYLDSLLTGTGETLARDTFQFVDQTNGRTLGIRADMTPQVARIDARSRRNDAPGRLVYTGTVLRTRVDKLGGSRNPLQFGAELFGDPSPESDIDIIRLMIDTVLLAGLDSGSLVLDLGHVGVFESLVSAAGLDESAQGRLFDAIERGSIPDLEAVLDALLRDETQALNEAQAEGFLALFSLHGSADVLERASTRLGGLSERVESAIVRLRAIITAIAESHPTLRCQLDLAELRGYRYHTGAVFALLDAEGRRLAQGGRYDDIGRDFGTARAATGYSGDLVALAMHPDATHHPSADTLLNDP